MKTPEGVLVMYLGFPEMPSGCAKESTIYTDTMKRRQYTIKTRFGAHVCVFEKDTKGYLVVAKDIKGVVTWGKNIAHAKAMAKEALELMIETTAIESPLSVAVKNNKYQMA